MAISFPNFLSAQLVKPDESGISDVYNNFYQGMNMPQDALIKKIQAEFARPKEEEALKSSQLANYLAGIQNEYARPNAEQSLATSRLSNRKTGLDIDKMVLEMQQQKELENQLRNYMNQGGQGGQGGQLPQQSMPSGQLPQQGGQGFQMPQQGQRQQPPRKMTYVDDAVSAMRKINPALADVLQKQAAQQVQPSLQQQQQQQASGLTSLGNPQDDHPSSAALTENNNVQLLEKGNPSQYGVDKMWDANPLSREFLKKKGFSKKQDIKFNAKTGQTTILTTYPSGRVTTQSTASNAESLETPLTSKMVSKHQGIIAAVDNAIPTIEKILDLNQGDWEQFPRSSGALPGLGWIPGNQSKSTEYEALVSSALDSLVGAYGLPMSNEGIETVKKQLLISHGETDVAYKKRLKNLLEDLKTRQAYSAKEVKKSAKNPPIDSGENSSFSSNDWEEV